MSAALVVYKFLHKCPLPGAVRVIKRSSLPDQPAEDAAIGRAGRTAGRAGGDVAALQADGDGRMLSIEKSSTCHPT